MQRHRSALWCYSTSSAHLAHSCLSLSMCSGLPLETSPAITSHTLYDARKLRNACLVLAAAQDAWRQVWQGRRHADVLNNFDHGLCTQRLRPLIIISHPLPRAWASCIQRIRSSTVHCCLIGFCFLVLTACFSRRSGSTRASFSGGKHKQYFMAYYRAKGYGKTI